MTYLVRSDEPFNGKSTKRLVRILCSARGGHPLPKIGVEGANRFQFASLTSLNIARKFGREVLTLGPLTILSLIR